MTRNIVSRHEANLFGSIWMIASMAGFAIEDMFVKAASVSLPVGQILIIFGLGGAMLFGCISLSKKEPLFSSDVLSRPMRIRVLFEITGRLFYILSLSLIPLSVATVILQATPLVVVLGAALFFGENVGWRRWAAIFIGLSGVLIIVQPGAEGFSIYSILAVIGMLGFAGRDLASRAAPASLTTSILGFYGFLSVVVAGVLFAIWEAKPFVMPEVQTSLFLLGSILSGIAAYSFLMKAMRTGDVSAVTPFRYTRLIFGIILGIVLFGEQLTPSMIVGSSLIVASGLFIVWRSKKFTSDR